MADKAVDTRGLVCPEPMQMVMQEIERMGQGRFQVLADSVAARENIKRLAAAKGWRIEINNNGPDFMLTLTK